MERLFKKLQNLSVTHERYTGIVCGYTEDMFLLAVEKHTFTPEQVIGSRSCMFREKFQKDTFVLPEYKAKKYHYVYTDEAEILRQNKKGKTTYKKLLA